MSTIDVFPARQGFPRPPDNGQPVPTNTRVVRVSSQGFPPAPLVNPFPIEPTPPQKAFLPATQGVPPVKSLSSVIPPAQNVDTMSDISPIGAPSYVVTEQGSIATIPQDEIKFYAIASVADYDTGLPPTAASVNIRITLAPATLNSYGFSLVGRPLYFTSGAWIPPGTTPQRTILAAGDAVVVVPNLDPSGVPLYTPGGPAPGDQIAVDAVRSESEVLFTNLGTVQNIIPDTTPLLSPPGTVTTDLPVQEVEVSDQATVIGTPLDVFPTTHHPI